MIKYILPLCFSVATYASTCTIASEAQFSQSQQPYTVYLTSNQHGLNKEFAGTTTTPLVITQTDTSDADKPIVHSYMLVADGLEKGITEITETLFIEDCQIINTQIESSNKIAYNISHEGQNLLSSYETDSIAFYKQNTSTPVEESELDDTTNEDKISSFMQFLLN